MALQARFKRNFASPPVRAASEVARLSPARGVATSSRVGDPAEAFTCVQREDALHRIWMCSLRKDAREMERVILECVEEYGVDVVAYALNNVLYEESWVDKVGSAAPARSLLHIFVAERDAEMVRVLAQHGADPNAIDASGESAVSAALVISASPAVVHELLVVLDSAAREYSDMKAVLDGAPSAPTDQQPLQLLSIASDSFRAVVDAHDGGLWAEAAFLLQTLIGPGRWDAELPTDDATRCGGGPTVVTSMIARGRLDVVQRLLQLRPCLTHGHPLQFLLENMTLDWDASEVARAVSMLVDAGANSLLPAYDSGACDDAGQWEATPLGFAVAHCEEQVVESLLFGHRRAEELSGEQRERRRPRQMLSKEAQRESSCRDLITRVLLECVERGSPRMLNLVLEGLALDLSFWSHPSACVATLALPTSPKHDVTSEGAASTPLRLLCSCCSAVVGMAAAQTEDRPDYGDEHARVSLQHLARALACECRL